MFETQQVCPVILRESGLYHSTAFL